MNKDAAEVLGLKALAWIMEQDDLQGVFMGAAGLSADDMRAGASDPNFLGGVLDFLCMDDAWVVGFCDSANLAYTDPLQARQFLPGGEQVHWT